MPIRHVVAVSLICAGALLAQRGGPAAQNAPAAAAEPTPIPPEASSVTDHELSLDGKALHYRATAGTLLIKDAEDKPDCSIFYVGYTLSGAGDLRTRPVTFLYNGGPGSASIPLHMASVVRCAW